jgi:tRNA(Ile)-lysidine synthase
MAALARDEEAWWTGELARIAPQLLLPGRAVRGGGRAASNGLVSSLSIDVTRLAALAPALQRRILRHCAEQLGAAPDFPSTEALRTLALTGHAGQKRELEGLLAERTPRELRLEMAGEDRSEAAAEYSVAIPGEAIAPVFGLRFRIEVSAPDCPAAGKTATIRNWKPGDRVLLRYSSGPRKAKEVLERLRVTGSSRALWPVLELDGRIVWMRGVELEPITGICIVATSLESADGAPLTGSSAND